MKSKRFSNQTAEQILKHLHTLLDDKQKYTLTADPLGIHFTVTESRKIRKKLSGKKINLKKEQEFMSKKQRRKSNTKKRTRPKIRTVKKGRTVNLKGQVY